MLILGLDSGISNIGLALYNSETDEIVATDYQRIDTNLADYYIKFANYLKTISPDILIYEKPNNNEGFIRNKKYGLMEIIGVQRLIAEQHKIPTIGLSPSNVKKLFTGRGNANKNIVKEEVDRRFKLNTSNTHINDAVAVACAYYIKQFNI